MKIINTAIEGVYIIEPQVFEDNRGYFFESYNKQKMDEAGLKYDFIQDNQSMSKRSWTWPSTCARVQRPSVSMSRSSFRRKISAS